MSADPTTPLRLGVVMPAYDELPNLRELLPRLFAMAADDPTLKLDVYTVLPTSPRDADVREIELLGARPVTGQAQRIAPQRARVVIVPARPPGLAALGEHLREHFELDRARRWHDESCDHSQCRRLPAARRAEKRDELTVPQGQIELFDHRRIAESLRDSA